MLRLVFKLFKQFEMLLLFVFITLIASHSVQAQVVTADVPREHQQQQQQHYFNQRDADPRQLGGGFNANALPFNGNFGSNSFGNQFNSGSYRPQPQTTTSAPFGNFNSLNAITNQNSHKGKEPNKYAHNHVIDRFTHHYPDGSYEYRYELADGTARYERGYFLLYDNKKTLVVAGYYAYRMPDGRYITVFYNADRNGYRQNQSITPQSYPNLPRRIDVPQSRNSADDSFAEGNITPNPSLAFTTTKRSGRL